MSGHGRLNKPIEEWLQEHAFSQTMKDCLCAELDMVVVADFRFFFESEDLLCDVKSKVTNEEYCKLDALLYDLKPHLGLSPSSDTLERTAPSTESQPQPAVMPPQVILDAIERQRLTAEEEEACLKKEKKEEARKKEVAATLARVKDSAAMDIGFLIDLTGSMRKYIDGVKDRVEDLIRTLSKLHAFVVLRIGFVGYRDFSDGDKRIVRHEFNADVDSFKSLLSEQEAEGGDDGAEAVLGGLRVVAGLNWSSQARLLFHIGDAPCHGSEFHDDRCTDNFKDGHPDEPLALDALNLIDSKQIQYYFCRITPHTDIMIKKFNELKGNGQFITTLKVNEMNFFSKIIDSASSSLVSSLSSSSRVPDGSVRRRKVKLDTTYPSNWESLPCYGMTQHSMTAPRKLEDLLQGEDYHCVRAFTDPMPFIMSMARKPFAKGGQRAAYYARKYDFLTEEECGQLQPGIVIHPPPSSQCTPQEVVIKESILASERQPTKNDYEKFLISHRDSMFFANLFNAEKPSLCPKVEFVSAHIVHANTHAPHYPYYIIEERIIGRFEKYNCNNGYIAQCPTPLNTDHGGLQTFSHWTYEVSNGALMVTDLQGVYVRGENKFRLTDPAIHSVKMLQYGTTNLAAGGFATFFGTHVCNNFCTEMGLKKRKVVTSEGSFSIEEME